MRIRRIMLEQFWRQARRVTVVAILLFVALPAPWARGEPPTADEEASAIVDDETVVSEEGTSQGDGGWKARRISLRKVGETPAFTRHSSEAFEDPDDRMSLELKYYFDLPVESAADIAASTAGKLSRGRKLDPSANLIAGPQIQSSGIGIPLPQPLHIGAGNIENDVEWLDYQSGDKAKVIAGLFAANEDSLALVVARVAPHEQGLALDKQIALRQVKADELPARCLDGGLLDTWDRPRSLGSRAMFLGRVIAVLKQQGGRFAVDFHGEMLHPDSDCRVWLWREESGIGRPVGIRFVEIPVKKSAGTVGTTWVLAVVIAGNDPPVRAIAFDYPLCRPAIMAQLQRTGENSSSGSQPDLEKLVGADLLDEFARRLVNGTYR